MCLIIKEPSSVLKSWRRSPQSQTFSSQVCWSLYSRTSLSTCEVASRPLREHLLFNQSAIRGTDLPPHYILAHHCAPNNVWLTGSTSSSTQVNHVIMWRNTTEWVLNGVCQSFPARKTKCMRVTSEKTVWWHQQSSASVLLRTEHNFTHCIFMNVPA